MRNAILLGLLCFCLPLGPALAQPGLPKNLPKTVTRPILFDTDAEFLRWTENYYRDPRPDLLDEGFRFFLDSELAQDEVKRVEIAAFFGAALSRLPAMAPAVRDVALRDRSYDSLFALVNTLWLADNDECRDILRKLAEEEPNEDVQRFIRRRVQTTSPIASGKTIETLAQMQLLWAQFGATGDPEIAERVSRIILTQYETSPEATIFQQSARQSLRARADKPQVLDGLRRAIEKADPSPLREDAQAFYDELTSPTPGPSPAP